MAGELILFFGVVVIGAIIIGLLILLRFWLSGRKIKKYSPSFEGEPSQWKNINLDQEALERRKINKNGYPERRVRSTQEEVSRVGDEEIGRLKDQIARAERELAERRS